MRFREKNESSAVQVRASQPERARPTSQGPGYKSKINRNVVQRDRNAGPRHRPVNVVVEL